MKFQNVKKEKAYLNYITAVIKKTKNQTKPIKAFQLCAVYYAKQWEMEVTEMFS